MKNIKEQLKNIATLREIRGKEDETLEKIEELIPQVEESKQWKELVTLYWEAHLVWQHMVMEERLKSKEEQDSDIIKDGAKKMLEFAAKANEIIYNNDLADMLGGSYRFLGRALTYLGKHEDARDFYEAAINCYTKRNEKNKLEVNGFLAESYSRTSDPVKGYELGIKTFNDYFESDIGKDLKKSDYYTWAIWMSGLFPRLVEAQLDAFAFPDKKGMLERLEKSKKELENPSGESTWGDSDFKFRIDEINSAIEKIKTYKYEPPTKEEMDKFKK